MRIVVAMSGGVDSSVAAALLAEQGHEVVGVHMKLHDIAPSGSTSKACCGLDDARDARLVAERLDIPFHVLDLREAFKKAVMDDLADEYLAGRTPNPCVHCNGVLKFRVLLQKALALGASALATGHYAQVVDGQLHEAVDAEKDQTYFLFPLTPKALAHTIFPLGGFTKEEVREHGRRLGLITADKPESQEICFVPDGDHSKFVAGHRPGATGAGQIVDESGKVLGEHDAYFRYTVGQRRGLGVALGKPAYVQRVEPGTGRVVVGGEPWHSGLKARRWSWIDKPADGAEVQVRIRHRGARIPSRIEGDTIHFAERAWAVAPGQAAVVYEGTRVLGGGWIDEALS